MSEKTPMVDFGAPGSFGAHRFRVEIPAARTGTVIIVEDYGYRGEEGARRAKKSASGCPAMSGRPLPTPPGANLTTGSRQPGCAPVVGTVAIIW